MSTILYPYEIALRDKLFDFVRATVEASGGDGDAYIVCGERYKEMADSFQAWEQEHEPWFTTRRDDESSITFSNSQEYICFKKDKDGIPDWTDLVVIP